MKKLTNINMTGKLQMLNEPLQCKRYKNILLSMMSCKYGIIYYGKDYVFLSDEQLSEIQPDDLQMDGSQGFQSARSIT